MDIYKPKIEEWEKLKKIRLEAIDVESKAFSGRKGEVDNSKEIWQSWIGQRKNNTLLFVREKSEIIGMIGMFDKEKAAQIWGVYVKKEYRGKGVGKLLLKSILQEASVLGYEKIELTVNIAQSVAISLYKSFGFLIAETKIIENEKKYLMRKVV